MVTQSGRATRPVPVRRGPTAALMRLRRRFRRWRSQVRPEWGPTLIALAVAAVVLALLTGEFPTGVPVSMVVLVVVLGGFFLPLRALALLYLVIALTLVYVAARRAALGTTPLNRSVVVLLGATALLMIWVARSRARIGVQGTAGESMLVDLRDRLRAQGELPVLPSGWGAEVVLRSAYGDQFSGDFLVATMTEGASRLELALVDVSGKGTRAGTRALLLSGALGGLIGAMPSGTFLPAANQYLLRQRWAEGFATAVHVTLDLSAGDFQVENAGHPPAAHYRAGSGTWDLLDGPSGPLLGVLDDATFDAHTGRLLPGDALLIYTDGVVETRSADLSVGIDRLLGEADHLVTRGFRGGAQRLVDFALAGETDDRACVLVWRERA